MYQETKRINYIVLISLLCFNFIFITGVAIGIVALIASLWIVIASFIASPLALLSLIALDLQSFVWWEFIGSIVLFAIGIFLYPIAKKMTTLTAKAAILYIKMNQQAIYY
ncbi:hypothetical protein GCM10007425_21150 [Lysinibacillus alkalisoli]|uniref:Uncharacterized protein n=1 Tax=Lysinibacillus alkalisoli TaxID=1911548 RepID=A0A917G707_9BACI|nr:DUF1700 domain-containing protein [Lysinibacillus alkalisoli]GGG26341.1 hypothetical protein GCM10007425_21150 [Lysinibacillus alkalisoli]